MDALPVFMNLLNEKAKLLIYCRSKFLPFTIPGDVLEFWMDMKVRVM